MANLIIFALLPPLDRSGPRGRRQLRWWHLAWVIGHAAVAAAQVPDQPETVTGAGASPAGPVRRAIASAPLAATRQGERRRDQSSIPGIQPQARLDNRIDNRVQLRLRNRLDPAFSGLAGDAKAFRAAEEAAKAKTRAGGR